MIFIHVINKLSDFTLVTDTYIFIFVAASRQNNSAVLISFLDFGPARKKNIMRNLSPVGSKHGESLVGTLCFTLVPSSHSDRLL